MKKIILSLSICLTTTLAFSQPEKSLIEFNLGFDENTHGNKLSNGWIQWGSGYTLKLDTIVKRNGKASLLIEPDGEKAPNSFGCVVYLIPSTYKAKEIEVRASLKLSNVTDGAGGVVLRIDGLSGMVLANKNTLDQNIQGTKDWSTYSLKTQFPENARTIYIGSMLTGKGELWADDFEVLLDGKSIQEAEIVKPEVFKADSDVEFEYSSKISDVALTPSIMEDLFLLGKIWGYLKYYHPSVASGEYNWDFELFRILPKILGAKSKSERNSILNAWVKSLGKLETANDNTPSGEVKIRPDLSWINAATFGAELANSLNEVNHAKRKSEHYYVGLVPNIDNPIFKNERPYYSMKYSDFGFRLLSLFRYWNIIQYYFPYKHLINEDWDKVLVEYIPKFVKTSDELEYKLTVLSLIARIHDTHANLWGTDPALNSYKGERYAPLEITFVENQAVVTDYFDKTYGENTGLKIGDVIESIDGKPVEKIVTENLPLTPASNYPTQLRDIARNLLRTNKTTLNITYKSATKTASVQVETFYADDIKLYAKYQKRDTCFKLINSQIAYLYPGSVRNEYLPSIMAKVQETKGLVIDFRCYPSDFIVFTLSEYLLPKAESFAKFSKGSITTPGLFTMSEELKVGKTNPGYYKGKIVIIINETTQSSAEYHTMAFRKAPRAIVIGSTTAAADGNVSRISLPGAGNTMISGIGIYYPDGTETQRVGIIPDIEVKPTIRGIREGKDELLEKAISLIKGK